jgi:hypothetical protein
MPQGQRPFLFLEPTLIVASQKKKSAGKKGKEEVVNDQTVEDRGEEGTSESIKN